MRITGNPQNIPIPRAPVKAHQPSSATTGIVFPQGPMIIGQSTGGLFEDTETNPASTPSAKGSEAFFMAPEDFGSSRLLDKFVDV